MYNNIFYKSKENVKVSISFVQNDNDDEILVTVLNTDYCMGFKTAVFEKLFNKIDNITYILNDKLFAKIDNNEESLLCTVYTSLVSEAICCFNCNATFFNLLFGEEIYYEDHTNNTDCENEDNVISDELKTNDEKTSVSPSTIARSIALFAVSIISILKSFGLINDVNIDGDNLYDVVLPIITVIIAIRCWWKNNSFTNAAIKADNYMNDIKNNNSK